MPGRFPYVHVRHSIWNAARPKPIATAFPSKAGNSATSAERPTASEDDPEAKAATVLAALLPDNPALTKERAKERLEKDHSIILGVRALQRVLEKVRGKGKSGRPKGSKNKKSQHRVTKSRHPHQLNRDTRTD